MRNPRLMAFWLLSTATVPAAAVPAADAGHTGQAAYFDQEIHPLLEKHCFKCHGDEKVEGGLVMTMRDGLLAGGKRGPALDLANPADSLLLQMLSYKDARHEMPPRGKLPDAEIAKLAGWVAMGAPYNPDREYAARASHSPVIDDEARAWWAYRPVATASPPAVADPAWAAHPVDAFVRGGLDAAGLAPNPPAPRAALLRRLHYDLTGLPPTLDEVREFETDAAPDAWEKRVDELLARPQFGEKWARFWLDLVRYAETNGFERDAEKPVIWRYRDYVVRAFNSNKPYDRFIREQLAGDELADRDFDALVATGYHRLMQWDDEPADALQHFYDVLDDNVATTAQVFLGTTMGCARCHDHKGDPIRQVDYARFAAFFHGLAPQRREGTLVAWNEGHEAAEALARRQGGLAEAAAAVAAIESAIVPRLVDAGVLAGTKPALALVPHAVREPHRWRHRFEDPGPAWFEIGHDDSAWPLAPGGFGRRGTPGAVVGTDWHGEAIWLRADFRLTEIPADLVLVVHHDEDVEVYLNNLRIHEAKGYQRDYQVIPLPPAARAALQTGKNVLAVKCRQSGGGQYIDAGLYTGPPDGGTPASWVRANRARAGEILGSRDTARFLRALDEHARLQAERPGVAVYAATETGPEPAPLHVHLRGNPHAPGEQVEPGFPLVLVPGEAAAAAVIPDGYRARGTSGRRRVLAEWIAGPANPLTARVMANRIWQMCFGRGLVPTPNDFGRLGEAPTHPELLDWLAAEFIRSGWDVKHLQRLILTSRSYRMSAAPREQAVASDPLNTRYWRHDMRRLGAEEIRDSMLLVSGQLNLAAGGPPVYPPLPEEVLATASNRGSAWGRSPPADQVRRSLYVKVKRSLRLPVLVDHDAPDPDMSCAARFNTTVPTQALGMLNSAFVNDQAAAFAARVRARSGDEPAAFARAALALALARPPTGDEVAACLDLERRLRDEAGLAAAAALDRLCLVILNLNEFVWLD
jgi:cytochrome c553